MLLMARLLPTENLSPELFGWWVLPSTKIKSALLCKVVRDYLPVTAIQSAHGCNQRIPWRIGLQIATMR